MLQHTLGRRSLGGVLLGLLVLSAVGCQSDKPWPYSPYLGPEQPACFPCTLWGGYYPTCWDEWPDHPCPCPTPPGVPQKPAGKPAAGSPFKPEAMPHKPTPLVKPEPKPPVKPDSASPLPPDPGLKPTPGLKPSPTVKPEPALQLPPEPGLKPGPDASKRSALDVPEPTEEPTPTADEALPLAPQPTAVPEGPPEPPGDPVGVHPN